VSDSSSSHRVPVRTTPFGVVNILYVCMSKMIELVRTLSASRIAAVIAWALLIVGASWNANVVRVAAAPFCPYLKDGIFAGGGVLTLAAAALGITSFIMLRTRPVEAAAATPAASVGGTTPNRPVGQSPSNEVVMGHPLLPPASKAQQPSKPQAYVQQVAPASHPQPQGNGQAPQNLQAPPPSAQDNGSQAPNQQFLPQALPAGAALAAAACAPQEPGEQPPRPLGVVMGQPQVQLPLSVPMNDTLQYPIPAPQVSAEAPITPPAPGASQGTGLSSVIRNELARATIRFAGKAMEHAVFSNNTATMVTDPTEEGDVGATDNGVAVV
jgi:hypothetical protein